MRRGIREMDLVLSAFADAHVSTMTDAQLDAYDALLSENDHDLYQWVTAQAVPPAELSDLVLQIRAMADGLTGRTEAVAFSFRQNSGFFPEIWCELRAKLTTCLSNDAKSDLRYRRMDKT